eukprot:Polyplicarium_translucidae@DN3197_c0_g1_i14.p1
MHVPKLEEVVIPSTSPLSTDEAEASVVEFVEGVISKPFDPLLPPWEVYLLQLSMIGGRGACFRQKRIHDDNSKASGGNRVGVDAECGESQSPFNRRTNHPERDAAEMDSDVRRVRGSLRQILERRLRIHRTPCILLLCRGTSSPHVLCVDT